MAAFAAGAGLGRAGLIVAAGFEDGFEVGCDKALRFWGALNCFWGVRVAEGAASGVGRRAGACWNGCPSLALNLNTATACTRSCD